MKSSFGIAIALTLLAAPAWANEHEKGDGPCKQIKAACEGAGFVQGAAKEGNGLWMDCVAVIMGKPAPKNAKKAPPSVDPSVVAACKAKHPDFGQGKHKEKHEGPAPGAGT